MQQNLQEEGKQSVVMLRTGRRACKCVTLE